MTRSTEITSLTKNKSIIFFISFQKLKNDSFNDQNVKSEKEKHTIMIKNEMNINKLNKNDNINSSNIAENNKLNKKIIYV